MRAETSGAQRVCSWCCDDQCAAAALVFQVAADGAREFAPQCRIATR